MSTPSREGRVKRLESRRPSPASSSRGGQVCCRLMSSNCRDVPSLWLVPWWTQPVCGLGFGRIWSSAVSCMVHGTRCLPWLAAALGQSSWASLHSGRGTERWPVRVPFLHDGSGFQRRGGGPAGASTPTAVGSRGMGRRHARAGLFDGLLHGRVGARWDEVERWSASYIGQQRHQQVGIVAMVTTGTVLIAIVVARVSISAMRPDCNAVSRTQLLHFTSFYATQCVS